MGAATQFALQKKHTLFDASMKAGICVRNNSNDKFMKFFKGAAKYSYKATADHIETVLFGKVVEYFKGLDSIPQNSIIVLCSDWSPCIKCAGRDAPSIYDFVKRIDAAKRGIQVKCRYLNYYSTEEGATSEHENGGKHIWKFNENARKVYDELQKDFGEITLPSGKIVNGTKNRSVLTIERGADF